MYYAPLMIKEAKKKKHKKKKHEEHKDDPSFLKSLVIGGGVLGAGNIAENVAATKYLHDVLLPSVKTDVDMDEEGAYAELKRLADEANFGETEIGQGSPSAQHVETIRKLRHLYGIPDSAPYHARTQEAIDRGLDGNIFMGGDPAWNTNPAVLAHEEGHMMGGPNLGVVNILGKSISPSATLLTGLIGNKSMAQASALLGTLAGAGTLISEIDASRRGAEVMSHNGANFKDSMRSFIGVPTYLPLALLPGATYALKNWLGGYSGDGLIDNGKKLVDWIKGDKEEEEEDEKPKEEAEIIEIEPKEDVQKAASVFDTARTAGDTFEEVQHALKGQPNWNEFKKSSFYKQKRAEVDKLTPETAPPEQFAFATMPRDEQDEVLYQMYLEQKRSSPVEEIMELSKKSEFISPDAGKILENGPDAVTTDVLSMLGAAKDAIEPSTAAVIDKVRNLKDEVADYAVQHKPAMPGPEMSPKEKAQLVGLLGGSLVGGLGARALVSRLSGKSKYELMKEEEAWDNATPEERKHMKNPKLKLLATDVAIGGSMPIAGTAGSLLGAILGAGIGRSVV